METTTRCRWPDYLNTCLVTRATRFQQETPKNICSPYRRLASTVRHPEILNHTRDDSPETGPPPISAIKCLATTNLAFASQNYQIGRYNLAKCINVAHRPVVHINAYFRLDLDPTPLTHTRGSVATFRGLNTCKFIWFELSRATSQHSPLSLTPLHCYLQRQYAISVITRPLRCWQASMFQRKEFPDNR